MTKDHLDTLAPALPRQIDDMAASVLKQACDRNLRLATAESCTGGLLASVLTDVKGCSHAFERGFVTYSDEAKHELLGVSLDLIGSETAVSRSVAIAMAEGALQRSRADLCVAVTGYTDDADGMVEAGLVHFALAQRGKATAHKCVEFGDIGRGGVRIACLATALGLFETALAPP